ncbi:hypothetical protein BDZ45DRAFT_750262 [Acephala macrosclerotiorum]|nr:hypothetical protein BDZ45DRAFT_750262 [Acephala macrosclerotiorum]
MYVASLLPPLILDLLQREFSSPPTSFSSPTVSIPSSPLLFSSPFLSSASLTLAFSHLPFFSSHDVVSATSETIVNEGNSETTAQPACHLRSQFSEQSLEPSSKDGNLGAAAQLANFSPGVVGATAETGVKEANSEASAPVAVSTGPQAISPVAKPASKPASPITKAAVSAPTTPEQGSERAAAEISTSRAFSPQ